MNEQTKQELTSNNGKLIELQDYDVRIVFDDYSRVKVLVAFYKKQKDGYDNHTAKFSDEDIDTLIQDLKDLSDWRHLRRLQNKLKLSQ